MKNLNFIDDGNTLTAYLKVTGVLTLNIVHDKGVQQNVYLDYRLSDTGEFAHGVSGPTPFIQSLQMGDGKNPHYVRIKVDKKGAALAPTVAQYDGDNVSVFDPEN